MAGGSGSIRQGGSYDKTNLWLYHHHLYPCLSSKPPTSETFKKRHRAETKRTHLKNIDLLQENILRIFAESLHCDLKIIHGSNTIHTNECIVRTRSPEFYEVLKPYFIYNNKRIECFLDTPGIFHQVESFVRLLYSNLDLSQEERLLVELIQNISCTARSTEAPYTDETTHYKERSFKKIPRRTLTASRRRSTLWKHCELLENNEAGSEDVSVDVSPMSSDMADSGLETGSASPRENTVSETSGMDLEESQAAEDISTDEDSNKITRRSKEARNQKQGCITSKHSNEITSCNDVQGVKSLIESALIESSSNDDATCSFDRPEQQQQLDSSGSSDENAHKIKGQSEEVSQYENHVLNDPFYESDCESDGNEQTNSFVPTESFEFIDPVNISPGASDTEKEFAKYEGFNKVENEKLNSSSEARSMTTEELRHELSHSNDLPIKKSSSSTSSYYFIDASSLNDENEVLSMEMARDRHPSGRIASYISNTMDYVPSRSNNLLCDEQAHKYTARKQSSLQGGHERVAEFERELKLTEHLEPLAETRKVKRVDSTSDEKLEMDKGIEKEALVVEIKEADSGESTQASPCPDNGTSLNVMKDEIGVVNNSRKATSNAKGIQNETQDKEDCEKRENSETIDETRRPSLIRRNTFELDSNEETLSVLRQEYERRQGSLVFQNSIPQYSGHRVDGDSCFLPAVEAAPPVLDIEAPVTSVADISESGDVRYDSAMAYLLLDKVGHGAAQEEAGNNCHGEISIESSDAVYPVIKSASDKFVLDRKVELLDDVAENSCNSLPVNLNYTMERQDRLLDLTKIKKRDERAPIVSGGASTSDYTKPTDSPIVRRKTESTPIVSGGSVIMNEPEVRAKPNRMSTSMTAWVVDMSGCNRSDTKSSVTFDTQEGMSQSFSSSDCIKRNVKKCKAQDKQHGSLGFFVNLNDMETKKMTDAREAGKKEQNGTGKQYCEFYIDMSGKNDNNAKCKKQEAVEPSNNKNQSVQEGSDKKNIFSMFIDLSEPSKKNGNDANRESCKGILSKVHDKTVETEEQSKVSDTFESDENGGSGSENNHCTRELKSVRDNSKPSVFMFIESDSPVVRRRTLSSSKPVFKRHSWNVDKSQSANGNGHIGKETLFRKEHKRAHSLSVDRGDIRRIQVKGSNSSHSLSEVARADTLNTKNPKRLQEQDNGRNMDTSSEDVFEFDTRDTPPNSHIEIVNEELRVSVKHHDYKELVASEVEENMEISDVKIFEEEYSEVSVWDKTGTESTEGHTRKSETFDISSGSGPSPGSDKDFELSDLLNGDVPSVEQKQSVAVGSKILETQKSLNEKIKKIECELKRPDCGILEQQHSDNSASRSLRRDEKSNNHEIKDNHSGPSKTTGSSFVRLSDLDKAPPRFDKSDVVSTKEDRVTYRMSNSIPETSWIESKLVMSRSSGPARTLSRKFTSVMTTSLPPKQKSPLEDLAADCEGEGIISESDLSSMQSSMGRSGAEGSTEETETSSLAGGKPYNRLGEDLLRMFLEEINPDVTIDVAGRRIRAHKCILSSRCQYFAAILSGGWVESAGNVVPLQGYSYNAVHFALCHIYSGESNIPDSISIVELATLADMLCLEGLKEVIGYTLKVKYCHLFHKPCQICAVGVLECMPLAAAYGLDEVYRKSLRWITRHFVRIWPCKAFATLPRELMDKCYHQHIVHMSTDNVLQTIMDCDKLLATLPNVRWAEPVFRLVSNLLETALKFLSDNFSGVLGNEKFQALGRELTWNISRLEDNFLAAADRLPPEQACKSYSKLHKMLATSEMDDPPSNMKWGQLFVDFLKKIQSRVEKCLVREAARAARTTTWLKMDLELRRRIQELACLVILPHETSKRPSRHSNFLKEPRAPSSRSTTSRSLDLRRVKLVISEHTDKTIKQATLAPQAKKVLSKPKSDPLERKVQEEKPAPSESASRPKSWPNKMEVKSRYLEPRNKSVTKETAPPAQSEKVMVQQRRKIMISSSDSSRTSSPAMKRAVDKKPLAKIKLPIKKDVKALSSDSLTEGNVSRANSRKETNSKSCGITRPESPSFKQKDTEIGLSVDSLAEPKKKPVAKKKTAGKMDTSMSADSLMTEITGTPKSSISNKLSPTLGRGINKMQVYDRTKKTSPPTQQRSPLTITRRPLRSLESSTAASRNRAVAVTPYQGSPNLRRNLLDAAKTPDVPSKSLHQVASRTSPRQSAQTTSAVGNVIKREKKETLSNQPSLDSPSKRSSPKSNAIHKVNKPVAAGVKKACKPGEDKVRTKCHNGEPAKQPTVGSRSGTFLKDEPTILKKADIKLSEANL